MEGEEADEQNEDNFEEGEDEDEEEEEGEEEEEEDEKDEQGSKYHQIFQVYQKMAIELQQEEGLEGLDLKLTRLWEAARSWHVQAEESTERADQLERDLDTARAKYSECKEWAQTQRREGEVLRRELEEAKRLADTAHAREQRTEESVRGLRAEVARLAKEITPPQASGDGEMLDPVALAAKKAEQLAREHERVMQELELVRERLDRAVAHSKGVEQQNVNLEKQVEELSQMLESQETETSKELRLKERAEGELVLTNNLLEQRMQDLALLNDQHEKTTRDHRALVEKQKEMKLNNDRLSRRVEVLSSRNNRLQQLSQTLERQAHTLRSDSDQKKLLLKTMEYEMAKQRKEVAAIQRQRQNALRSAELAQGAKSDALREMDQLRTNVVTKLEDELRLAMEHQRTDTRTIERLNRDKEILAKTLSRCHEVSGEQTQTLRIQEQARRALADELDMHTVAARRQNKHISNLELERDRLVLQTAELEVRVDESLEEVRLKQMAVYECRRRVEEGEARFRQQQNLYEAVRADRNTFAKHLLDAHDVISELKQKLKVQGHHVEQMKEDISMKEAELRRANKAVEKTDKEKEGLRVELQATRDDLSQARATIAAAAAEERRLLGVIQGLENEQRQLLVEMEQMVNERDVLGSQLVRRNDEVALLYEKMHLLESTLHRGEAQYDQRLEDIRLLKIEVRRLRNEKTLLQRSLDNMADLRREVFHLERDLTRERQRTRALEEELQSPLNVHRWRKLKGTDPGTFDLIEKVQLLQKRLLAQAALSMERDTQLQDALRLYAGLRQLLERQPGPRVAVTLHRTQQALRQRGRKMKVMAAEANMLEAQVTEFKSALEQANSEALCLRRRQAEHKRRERKLRQAAAAATARATAEPPPAPCPTALALPPPTGASGRRFVGGGYNMAPQQKTAAASA